MTVFSALLMVASGASAAAGLPQPATEIVVVTATPLGDRSDALSQGVAVVNRSDALSASLSGGIGEALSGVAGVRSTFYGPNASRPIIRGLGEDRIRLMLNGLTGIDASTVSPDHAPGVDGLDADRIEVLKGPAALRFGGNAIGGVVNVVDGRLPETLPDKPISGEIFVGSSSAENARAGALRLSATTGQFVFRIDGLARSSDDYDIPGFAQTAALRAQTGDQTTDSIFNSRGEIWALGASAARISARTNLALSVRTTRSEYGIPGEEAFIDLEQTRVDGRAIFSDIGFLETLTISGTSGDYAHSEIGFDGTIGTIFTNSGYEGRIEARLKPIGLMEGMFGFQFGSNDFAAAGDEAFILPVTIDQSGLFGFQRYHRETWGGEIGARFEQRKYSGLAGQRSFDLASVSGSVFAVPLPKIRLTLSAARTQRAPTEVELFADGPHAATQAYERGNPALKTEIATSFEAGLAWRTNGWTAQLDTWRVQFDGFIGFAPTGNVEDDLPVFEVAQENAILSGLELSVRGPIWAGDQWSVYTDVNVDFVRGKYDDGKNIARIPPRLVTFGIDAKRENWSVRGEVQVLGEQSRVAEFETTTDGATTYNMRLAWQPLANNDDVELILEGRNLSNEDVREHSSFLKDFLPKPGRSIRVTARAKF